MEINSTNTASMKHFSLSTTLAPTTATESDLTEDSFYTVKITFYVLIFALTLVGNGILIAAFLKFKHLRTPLNLLILNLSLCDTFMVFSIPIEIAHTKAGHFLLGVIGCKLLNPLSTMALTSASFTLLSIAIERYKVIRSPLKLKFTRRKSLVIIGVIHFTSLLSVIPYMLHLKLSNNQCTETWTLSARRIYTVYLFAIQYGIPLPVMMISYTISWLAILRHNLKTIKIIEGNKSKDADNSSSDTDSSNKVANLIENQPNNLVRKNFRRTKLSVKKISMNNCFRGGRQRSASKHLHFEASLKCQKQTKQTLKMFICVVTVFSICMLPNQITWMLLDFSGKGPDQILTHVFYFITFTNSICNPWIYGGINPVFRRAYKMMICKKLEGRRPGRRRRSSSVTMISRMASFTSNGNGDCDDSSSDQVQAFSRQQEANGKIVTKENSQPKSC